MSYIRNLLAGASLRTIENKGGVVLLREEDIFLSSDEERNVTIDQRYVMDLIDDIKNLREDERRLILEIQIRQERLAETRRAAMALEEAKSVLEKSP